VAAKTGKAFIKHEFDEAIAVQQCIVEAETALADGHPLPSARTRIKATLKRDREYLKDLRSLGAPYGATGEVEDVAGGLTSLMAQTLESARTDGAESDYYEAHAVLLNLKRKQMDSAGGIVKIARDQKDSKLRDAALEFERAQKTTSKQLASELATFAVQIANA
jgi:hypothetical protein